MAKTTTQAANENTPRLVRFSEIHWFRKDNLRDDKDYGSPKDADDLRNSLAHRGWMNFKVILACPIKTDADLTPAQKEAGVKSELTLALEERQERWDKLKQANTPEALVELEVFKRLYVKDDKLVAPKYSGNAGFRRSGQFFPAMVQRFRDDTYSADEKILDQVPVIVKKYTDDAERIVEQQSENEVEELGTKAISDRGKLKITKKLYDLGKREVYIRRLYKSSTGQKLYGICLSNDYWPKLRIFDRCFLEESDSDAIPLSRVRHNKLIELNNRFEADQKRAKGQVLTEREKGMAPIKESDVADYFNSLRQGSQNPSPIMKRADIEGIMNQCKVHWFRVPAQAIVANNSDFMSGYLEHSEALNLHKVLIDNGHGDASLAALKLVQSQPQVVSLVVSALSLLSPDELLASVKATLAAKAKAQAASNATAPAGASK